MSVYAEPKDRPVPPPVQAGAHRLAFGERFYVMGVVNVTPDSFSDGGDFFDTEAAIDHGLALADQGADILDIGGESTRPGADPVALDEEADRVLPVVEALADRTDAIVSIDTTKAEIAARAAERGATMINDVSGLGFDEQMGEVVADTGAAFVLMHILGDPETMQERIDYDDIVDDIAAYFDRRLHRATEAGIDIGQIILDPGIGFGKTVAQNYRLIREVHRFFDFGRPLLLGTSRKSCIGAIVDRPPKERIWGTAATVACGLMAGADIVRVHDVAEMYDVVRVTEAIAGIEDDGGD